VRRAVIALLPALLVAGCGSPATNSRPATTATTAAPAAATTIGSATTRPPTTIRTATTLPRRQHAAKPPTAIRVANSNYGPTLVDRRGVALSLFPREPAGNSRCEGACAAAWPPYLITTRHVAAEAGARTDLVGTIRRRDGRLQVTYRGHPLYYYVGDHRPHQVLCQAVTEFGGTWYVVTPGGSAIR
jgi:predicted lipoprotein with Yx(FWY)xxD motif